MSPYRNNKYLFIALVGRKRLVANYHSDQSGNPATIMNRINLFQSTGLFLVQRLESKITMRKSRKPEPSYRIVSSVGEFWLNHFLLLAADRSLLIGICLAGVEHGLLWNVQRREWKLIAMTLYAALKYHNHGPKVYGAPVRRWQKERAPRRAVVMDSARIDLNSVCLRRRV